MSTSVAIIEDPRETPRSASPAGRHGRRIDGGMLFGILFAAAALIAGIEATGIGLSPFFQPTGALIVLGGTLGVMFITTPGPVLSRALKRVRGLISTTYGASREELVEEIVSLSRTVRGKGLLAIEPEIESAGDPFLKSALLLALDVESRHELQSALENKVRLGERQSDADAKVLEVAGGFAPAIGVLGTVVGLIDALRQFSSLPAVASGMGAAFTSTIYGLALANLIMLPAAHRIRTRAAESFDIQDLMAEGALCLFDGMHPRLVRQRLESFLRAVPEARRGSELREPSASEIGA
jgi:chemotaxis protein MotA